MDLENRRGWGWGCCFFFFAFFVAPSSRTSPFFPRLIHDIQPFFCTESFCVLNLLTPLLVSTDISQSPHCSHLSLFPVRNFLSEPSRNLSDQLQSSLLSVYYVDVLATSTTLGNPQLFPVHFAFFYLKPFTCAIDTSPPLKSIGQCHGPILLLRPSSGNDTAHHYLSLVSRITGVVSFPYL